MSLSEASRVLTVLRRPRQGIVPERQHRKACSTAAFHHAVDIAGAGVPVTMVLLTDAAAGVNTPVTPVKVTPSASPSSVVVSTDTVSIVRNVSIVSPSSGGRAVLKVRRLVKIDAVS